MPEPILAETTTDIDATEVGEREIEANFSHLRSRAGWAFDLQVSPEFEILLPWRLGIKVEPSFERAASAGSSASNGVGMAGGLSWKLVQDFTHDVHVQAEVNGAYSSIDSPNFVQPSESPSPFWFDLKSGFRTGFLTLRNSLGFSAGGMNAHLPVRGSAALLTDIDRSGRYGFWGVEMEADGARTSPVTVALDLVPNLAPSGLPFALGFVLPFVVGADARTPSYGFFVRLFYESEREQAYTRQAHKPVVYGHLGSM
jgi:hypothetical protein